MDSYEFETKRLYRVAVWLAIERRCALPVALRRVIVLDTREGLEVLHLLQLGYQPQNIMAVNDQPVEVALLTKKLDALGYSRVLTSGTDWSVAVRKAVGVWGSIDVMNFDGTGCLSMPLIELLRDSIRVGKPKCVAVNMLAGREAAEEEIGGFLLPAWADLYAAQKTQSGQDCNANHLGRVVTLLTLASAPEVGEKCWIHLGKVAYDTYMSASRQPMVWCVFCPHAHATAPPKLKTSIRIYPACSGVSAGVLLRNARAWSEDLRMKHYDRREAKKIIRETRAKVVAN